MAYTKTTWVDEVPAETPVKYKITDDTGGVIAESATIETVTSITAGTALNAANLNKIEEGLEAVAAQADAADKKYPVLACYNGTVSLNTDGTVTLVQFNTEIYDPDGVFSNNRYTASVSGYYFVASSILLNSFWYEGNSAHLHLYKNGAMFANIDTQYLHSNDSAARYIMVSGSVLVYLAAGDYIDIRIYINSGSYARTYSGNTTNKETKVSVIRVG